MVRKFGWFALSEQIEAVLFEGIADEDWIHLGIVDAALGMDTSRTTLLHCLDWLPLVKSNLQKPLSALEFANNARQRVGPDVQEFDPNRRAVTEERV